MKTNQATFIIVRTVKGFTLLELIVVILMMTILATTVIPRFLNNDGFNVQSFRSEVVSTLRLIQLKAMQNTQGDSTGCHQVNITNVSVTTPATCPFTVAAQVANDEGITITTNIPGKRFLFDGMGRLVDAYDNIITCTDLHNDTIPCTISVTGSGETAIITIENEGYIHGS